MGLGGDWGVVNNLYRPRCGIWLRNQHTVRGWDGIWHPVWDWNRPAWREGGKAGIRAENERASLPLSLFGWLPAPPDPPSVLPLNELPSSAPASWTFLYPQLLDLIPICLHPGCSGEAPVQDEGEAGLQEHYCGWAEAGTWSPNSCEITRCGWAGKACFA